MAGIARRDRGIIDIDHRHRVIRQPLRQPRGTDHRHRRGILDHEPDTPIRMIDIDRQIRCTAFEYRQDRDDRLNRALQQQPDHITRTHTLINQQMRQPISRLIKLAIGQRPIPTHQRRHLSTAGHLRGEQPRNRHRLHQRLRQHRPITHHIQPRMLGPPARRTTPEPTPAPPTAPPTPPDYPPHPAAHARIRPYRRRCDRQATC
ncbi:hypothetical protein DSM43518_04271 [Mycobacterium marinum]|nr:hypothetical protein DSM43518_04271 [Mycobacterium marinum]